MLKKASLYTAVKFIDINMQVAKEHALLLWKPRQQINNQAGRSPADDDPTWGAVDIEFAVPGAE